MTSLTRNISRSNLTISLPLWKNPRWLAVRFQNVPIWPNRLSYYSKTSNIIPRSNLPIHKLEILTQNPLEKNPWWLSVKFQNLPLWSKYYVNECKGFIRFPNARKHLKPQGHRPSGFIVFKPLETWSTSFWNDFFKETIQNDAVLYFSHFSVKCIVCVVCCIQSAFTIFVSFCF